MRPEKRQDDYQKERAVKPAGWITESIPYQRLSIRHDIVYRQCIRNVRKSFDVLQNGK